jgi:hypothetical protein
MESGFGDDSSTDKSSPNDAPKNQTTSSFSSNNRSTNSPSSSSSTASNVHQRSVSPRTLNSRMDSYMVRKILDNSLVTRESIRNAIEHKLSSQENVSVGSTYNDDFKNPIELAIVSYGLDKKRNDKKDNFESLSDFIIFNFAQKVEVNNVVGFIFVKFGLYPASVR